MIYWLFLLAAIIAEVLGTSAMKYASGSAPLAGYLAMYPLIALSYFCLARAVQRIPLGVAYALWEGLGLTMIALVGTLLFAEPLSTCQTIGILLLLGGIALLKSGTHEGTHEGGHAS